MDQTSLNRAAQAFQDDLEAFAEAQPGLPIAREMGFDWSHTGGGCTAFEKDRGDGCTAMVTSDASIEGDPDEREWIATVVRLDGRGWHTSEACFTLQEALEAALTMRAPEIDEEVWDFAEDENTEEAK